MNETIVIVSWLSSVQVDGPSLADHLDSNSKLTYCTERGMPDVEQAKTEHKISILLSAYRQTRASRSGDFVLTIHSTAKYRTRLSGSVKHERTLGMMLGKYSTV